jgi:hypothetical protein
MKQYLAILFIILNTNVFSQEKPEFYVFIINQNLINQYFQDFRLNLDIETENSKCKCDSFQFIIPMNQDGVTLLKDRAKIIEIDSSKVLDYNNFLKNTPPKVMREIFSSSKISILKRINSGEHKNKYYMWEANYDRTTQGVFPTPPSIPTTIKKLLIFD